MRRPAPDASPAAHASSQPLGPRGRIGGRRKKLDSAKRQEIAESVITGRKSGRRPFICGLGLPDILYQRY
jgi:hypothetical protein